MLTAVERETVRDEVGDAPDDATLDATHARVGTLGGTIYAVLARRLANLLAAPTQFAVPGEYSQSTAANVQALQKQLQKWEPFAPEGLAAELGITHLVSRHTRGPVPVTGGAFDVEG